MALEPVTLSGRHVELVPLARDHHDGLVCAVEDGRLWELWYTNIPAPEDMEAEIERRFEFAAKGTMLPFTVLDRVSGRIAGMTSYMNIDLDLPRVEIGAT